MINFFKKIKVNKDPTYHEIPSARIWLKDGILFVVLNPNASVDLPKAMEFTKTITLLAKRPVPMLCDISNAKEVSPEARHYYAHDPDHLSLCSAKALIVQNSLSRVIGNVFINRQKPKRPTRLFTSYDDAIIWLRKFKQSSANSSTDGQRSIESLNQNKHSKPETHTKNISPKELQTFQILETLASFAARNFDAKAHLTGNDSAMDDISAAVNMLGEELHRQIIQLKKHERELFDTSEHLTHIFNSALSAIIATNRHGIITNFNLAASRTFGYEPEEIIGKNIKILTPPSHRLHHDKYIDLYHKTGQSNVVNNEREVTASHKDGTILNIRLQVSRIDTPDTMSFIAIIRDITDVKELQAQLIQSGKLAALGEMSSGLAHEINNPLLFIKGFNKMIEKRLRQKHPKALADIEDLITDVDESCERIKKIVNHFRNFSRQSEHKFAPTNLVEITNRSFTLLSEQLRLNNISVQIKTDEDIIHVYGDHLQIEQVLVNLITNARDAIIEQHGSRGGEITVLIRSTESFAILEVTDNGIGIKKANRSLIFNPFFTTKEVGKGAGLGLSISYGIITDHKGTIECISNSSEGSMFRLSLPLYNEHDQSHNPDEV